jgi:CRP-like cAMP-binding protein
MPKRLPRPNGQNYLIETLLPEDRALLQPHLTDVTLDRGMVLEEPYHPIEDVVFPISGITSMIVFLPSKQRRIEGGLFGWEGVSGSAVLLGNASTPNELRVQVPGHGVQISAERLRELVSQSASLQRHLLLFIHSFMIQMSQTSLSNKHGSLEERLARWLLMSHDRVDGDRLNLTHEFLATMLGVRRAGVTEGTAILEGKGVILAKRGEITILDREGLEEEAGGSYGVAESEYLRLLGNGTSSPSYPRK